MNHNSILSLGIKGLFVLTAMCLSTPIVHAQFKHEYSIHAGGGLSTLTYTPAVGTQSLGFGGVFGLGYAYYFAPQWGIATGIEAALYNSATKFDSYAINTDQVDIDGVAFNFRSKVTNYHEKQQLIGLQIPVMFRFQTLGTHRFYVGLGAKLALPLSATYGIASGNYSNSGYYPYENYEYTTQTFRGFGAFDASAAKQKLNLGIGALASLEVGGKWRLSDKMALYTGIYVDYGLNNINKEPGTTQLVGYNVATPADLAHNSVMTAKRVDGAAFTGATLPLAAGIKLSLAFGCGGHSPRVVEQSVVEEEIVAEQPKDDSSELEAAAKREAERQAQAAREAERQAREAKEREAAAAKAATEKAAKERSEAVIAVAQPVDHYAVGQFELTEAQQRQLDSKVEILKRYPDLKVICEGHTCDLGSDAVNQQVGMQRAEAAKAYLVSKGIAAERISTVSKRDTEPLVPNTSIENRKINRRVVVVVLK